MAHSPASNRRAPVAQLKKAAAADRPHAKATWRLSDSSSYGGGVVKPTRNLKRRQFGFPVGKLASWAANYFSVSSIASAAAVRSHPPLAAKPTPAANNPVNRTAGNRRRLGYPPRAASGYFHRWASINIALASLLCAHNG